MFVDKLRSLFTFGSNSSIGVCIGSSSIKVAELKRKKSHFELTHFAMAEIPDEAIVNREIISHMSVVDVLRELVQSLKLKGRTAVTSISGANVVVKKLLVDPAPSHELMETIIWEAEQYIPFNINDVAYDYQILNKNGPQGKMEVLLVACKKEILSSYQAVLRDAGLVPATVDIDYFALQNVYEVNYESSVSTAVIDIGAVSTRIVVCADKQPLFTRDAQVGGRTLTQEIQRHLQVSFQEAEVLKIDHAMQVASGEASRVPQEVADLMQVMAENFASEIKRSLDFYNASNAGPTVQQILLSGGSASIAALPAMVQASTKVPTAYLNPFQNIRFDEKVFSPEYITRIQHSSVVPIGLALRGFS